MIRKFIALFIGVLALTIGTPAYAQKQAPTKTNPPAASTKKAEYIPWTKSKDDKLVATISHDQLLNKDIILGVTVKIGTKDIFMWEDMDSFLEQKGSTLQIWTAPGNYYRIERRDGIANRPENVPTDMFVWLKTQLTIKKRVKDKYILFGFEKPVNGKRGLIEATWSSYETFENGTWQRANKPARPVMRT